MKFAKLVRTGTTLALLAMTAISLHVSVKAKEAYHEMKMSCDVLRSRMSDMRVTINMLSDQIKTHQSTLARCEDADRDEAETDNTEESGDTVVGENEADEFYTVQEYNGIIGVFDDEGILVRKENVMVSSLSAADRKDLEIGIRVPSKELESLLEELK